MNLVFTIALQCAVIIKCKYFFSYKSHIKLCYFHPHGSLFVSVPVSEPVYRRGLMLGKRAVRGDKEGAPQYTLAAGKQTQNIDYIIFTDTQSSPQLMFTRREVNSAPDHRLMLCISFAAAPRRYVRLWPVSAPNFPHHIQSRPGNGQLHYSQYLKSPLMCFLAVRRSVSSESQSFKCSCADCGCRW